MRKQFIYIFPFLLLATLAFGIALMPKAKAAFDHNFVMSDSVFDNVNTMNTSDIDAFLNKYPSSCISTNHGYPWPEPIGYSPANGFQYSFSPQVSAGTVI